MRLEKHNKVRKGRSYFFGYGGSDISTETLLKYREIPDELKHGGLRRETVDYADDVIPKSGTVSPLSITIHPFSEE